MRRCFVRARRRLAASRRKHGTRSASRWCVYLACAFRGGRVIARRAPPSARRMRRACCMTPHTGAASSWLDGTISCWRCLGGRRTRRPKLLGAGLLPAARCRALSTALTPARRRPSARCAYYHATAATLTMRWSGYLSITPPPTMRVRRCARRSLRSVPRPCSSPMGRNCCAFSCAGQRATRRLPARCKWSRRRRKDQWTVDGSTLSGMLLLRLPAPPPPHGTLSPRSIHLRASLRASCLARQYGIRTRRRIQHRRQNATSMAGRHALLLVHLLRRVNWSRWSLRGRLHLPIRVSTRMTTLRLLVVRAMA